VHLVVLLARRMCALGLQQVWRGAIDVRKAAVDKDLAKRAEAWLKSIRCQRIYEFS